MQQIILCAVTLLAFVVASNCILESDELQGKQPSKPTSVEVQLNRCAAPQTIADLLNLRLLLVWYSADSPIDPVEFLRNILTDDLDMPKLAFAINRVRILPNQMIFDMSSSLSTHFVYRKYCKLFAKISEFDEPALSYEIRKTDFSFYE